MAFLPTFAGEVENVAVLELDLEVVVGRAFVLQGGIERGLAGITGVETYGQLDIASVIGALELADAVIEAANEPNNFKMLYDWSMPYKGRIELIAKEIYGADGVDFATKASKELARLEAEGQHKEMGLCMVKTHLSLSDNPALKGAPKGWRRGRHTGVARSCQASRGAPIPS